jgi:hypothetical protein
MYQIIGSRLIKHLFPDFKRGNESDWDILTKEPIQDKSFWEKLYGGRIELHYIPLIWDALKDNPKDTIFTLKTSHVPWSTVHKPKTYYDIFFLSGKGCKIDERLFFALTDFWKEKFGEKWRADFTKESSDFFDDAVSRESLHDELHLHTAKYHQPAFKFLQDPNQTTVWVCPEKFKNADEDIRRRVIIEEAQTLALERFIIPERSITPHHAYTNMVEVLIDRLAPLWMVPYIANNFHFFINHKEDFYSHYKQQEHVG